MNIKRAADHLEVMNTIHPYPKPEKQKKTRRTAKSRRKILEGQLEAIIKEIVFWRDGQQCVEKEIDGARCGNGLQWGHYVPRKQSAWLKYSLVTFCQCGSHNYLHDKGAQTMATWFAMTFGTLAMQRIEEDVREHRGKDRTIAELEDMLQDYDTMFDTRYYVGLDLCSLVEAGFYGQVIRQAWIDEGRITVK